MTRLNHVKPETRDIGKLLFAKIEIKMTQVLTAGKPRSWANARQFFPPVGLVLVACVPSVQEGGQDLKDVPYPPCV